MMFYRVDVALLHREDFLSLTLAQQALLLRLRGYAAENGALPADLHRIVRRFGGKARDVAALEVWFPMQPDGLGRVDPELEFDRARLADVVEKRRTAGKLRWAQRESETDSEDDGARPEQDRDTALQGRGETDQRPNKHSGPRANAEHMLGVECDPATTYPAGTAGGSTGGGEHMLSHASLPPSHPASLPASLPARPAVHRGGGQAPPIGYTTEERNLAAERKRQAIKEAAAGAARGRTGQASRPLPRVKL